MFFLFVFKQKTAYEMRISDWSSDVCSSDLYGGFSVRVNVDQQVNALLDWISKTKVAEHGILGVLRRSPDGKGWIRVAGAQGKPGAALGAEMSATDLATLDTLYKSGSGFAQVHLGEGEGARSEFVARSEEHTSELQSLMRHSF